MEKEYNPDDSIIRLNEYEYHFVKEYYPDVDPIIFCCRRLACLQ